MEAALQLEPAPVATHSTAKRPCRRLSTPSLDDTPAILPLRVGEESGVLQEPEGPAIEAAPATKSASYATVAPWDRLVKPLLPPSDTLPLLVVLRVASPLRPPDWLWLRAARLRLDGLEPSRHINDSYQITLVKFQDRLAACRNADDWQRLRSSMPSLFEAWQVHHQGGPAMVAELKARLLAREPMKAIAKKLFLKPKAVRWFERAFFNIRDRLDAPGWIVHHAIHLHEKNEVDRLYKVWMLLGYAHGPLFVDELARDFTPAHRPASAKHVPSALLDDTMATLRRQAVVAVRLLSPSNPKEAAQLVKIFVKLSALDHEHRKRQAQHVDITPNINVAYEKLVQRLELAETVQAEGKVDAVLTEHLGQVQSPWLF